MVEGGTGRASDHGLHPDLRFGRGRHGRRRCRHLTAQPRGSRSDRGVHPVAAATHGNAARKLSPQPRKDAIAPLVFRSVVAEDVQEPPEGITDKKAAHAPGLRGGPIGDRMPGLGQLAKDLVQVIDFDGEIGNGRIRAALGCHAELRRGRRVTCEGDDPAMIHGNIHAEDVAVEATGRMDVRRADIRDYAPYRHRPDLRRDPAERLVTAVSPSPPL
ncbi:hypothetical protein CHELA1G11_11429 [Hyphomicrobiales bacterium]|nr:hypothetical protein CHELA1G11_11429 [Hyphomicrobiales bacterium]